MCTASIPMVKCDAFTICNVNCIRREIVFFFVACLRSFNSEFSENRAAGIHRKLLGTHGCAAHVDAARTDDSS